MLLSALRLAHEGHVATEGFSETLTLPLVDTKSQTRLTMPRAGQVKGFVRDAKSGEPFMARDCLRVTRIRTKSPELGVYGWGLQDFGREAR